MWLVTVREKRDELQDLLRDKLWEETQRQCTKTNFWSGFQSGKHVKLSGER